MVHWLPTTVPARPASNELLPGTRSRGELDILEVGAYRKVVLATPAKPTQRRGTFFSSSS